MTYLELEIFMSTVAPTWLGRDNVCCIYEEHPDPADVDTFSIIVETTTGIRPVWLPLEVEGTQVLCRRGGPYVPQTGANPPPDVIVGKTTAADLQARRRRHKC